MPASHLVYARGARLALISATMRKIGRCDCSLTCSVCLHQTIKDAPCASVQGAWQRCLLNINASKQRIVCKVCSKVCSSFSGRAWHAQQVNTQALNVIRLRAMCVCAARSWICDSLRAGGVCVGTGTKCRHIC